MYVPVMPLTLPCPPPGGHDDGGHGPGTDCYKRHGRGGTQGGWLVLGSQLGWWRGGERLVMKWRVRRVHLDPQGWLAGYQTCFDLSKSAVTKNNFGVGYTAPGTVHCSRYRTLLQVPYTAPGTLNFFRDCIFVKVLYIYQSTVQYSNLLPTSPVTVQYTYKGTVHLPRY